MRAAVPRDAEPEDPPRGGRRPLAIGIDAGPMIGHGGISSYVGPLVRGLLAADGEFSCHLLLRRGWLGDDGAAALAALAPVSRLRVPDRVLTFWWDRLGWTLPVARHLWTRLDIFLATCLVAPVLSRGHVVSIVYDLIPLKLPSLFPDRNRFQRRVERLVRRSSAVIAISQRTREDLCELLGVDPERVHVVYPGRGEAFRPVPPAEAARVAERYGIRQRYVLYLGGFGPHKNVATLLRAYERARRQGALAAKLVLAGNPRWGEMTSSVLETLRVREEVIVPGPVPAADLPGLYTGADCFIFPSRYEGFGLPVLEAMACGTPVIVSDRGALPEVAGQAGVFVDPEDAEAIARAMCEVAGDPNRRARLAEAGLAQAARFSWARSAADLFALFRDISQGRESGA